MADQPPATGTRLPELDGMRGWAALSVVLSHLILGVFVNLAAIFIPTALRPVLETLLGGTLDVAVFFVLSGDALSASYWRRRSRRAVVNMAAKRYLRLEVPILASCLVVFALIRCGLVFNQQAAPLLHNQDWLGAFLSTHFGALDVIGYALFGAFSLQPRQAAFNPFLWTMRIELLGSALVFAYLLLDARIRWKAAALLLLTAALLQRDSFLACFPFGMLCGAFRARGGFERLRQRRDAQVMAVLAAAAALVIGTTCNRVWQGWLLPSIIAACVLVFSVHASTALRGFCARPFSCWLGRLSFPLYLMHYAVIVSFTSGAVLVAEAHGGLGPLAIWLIVFGSAALSLLAARLFLPVEALTARISDSAVQAARVGWGALRTPPTRLDPVGCKQHPSLRSRAPVRISKARL